MRIVVSVVTLGLLSILTFGVSNCPMKTEPSSEEIYFFVVFDPTVLSAVDGEKRDELFQEIRGSITNFPEGGKIAIFAVDGGFGQESIIYSHEFVFDSYSRDDRKHRMAVEAEFDGSIRPAFEALWAVAHDEQEIRKLRSCILYTLFDVAEGARNRGCGEGMVSCHLILISDMLEACNAWGQMINMEEDLTHIEFLNNSKLFEIRMEEFSTITIAYVPNDKINTPEKYLIVKSGWEKFFIKAGGSLKFQRGFKENALFSKR